VPLSQIVRATFSEVLDPTTINTTTFTLSNGLTGTVTYDESRKTAYFYSYSLSTGTTYTATITIGVKDLAGNNMALNYVWSFTTLTTTSIPPVVPIGPIITGKAGGGGGGG
jgi:hypothetical protein